MKIEVTQSELNKAYKIVQADLLTKFQQMKAGSTLRVTNIGIFEKRAKQITPKLKKAKGKTYRYYQIAFRMSQVLKRALD